MSVSAAARPKPHPVFFIISSPLALFEFRKEAGEYRRLPPVGFLEPKDDFF